jgi:hypothetical protein
MRDIWKILVGIGLIAAFAVVAVPDQTIRFLAEDSVGAVPTVGLSRILTTGTVYFVDSNHGASTNAGTTPDAPLDSLSSALSVATANAGDVILFMPGHAETLVANTEITIEGLTLRSLGNGDNRAVFTFGTATTANIEIKADNVTIDNLIFKNDIDNQASVIESIKAYTVIQNCEFYEGSSKQFLEGILFSNADCDHCKVLNCRFIQATDGGDNAITLGAALDDCEIGGCYIHGDWDDAGIHNPTGNVATRLLIHDNIVANVATGQHAIELVSACTGEAKNNMLYGDTSGTVFDPGSLKCGGNLENVAIDQGAVQTPSIVGTVTADTDVDISAAVYTGYITLLTVTAPATGLVDLRIDIDANKTTTGLDAVATAADTFDCCLVGQVDGTNYRTLQTGTQITANGDGSLENSESGWSFHVGPLAAAETVIVKIKLSAERDDAELPYRVTYIGAAPTVTAVAAG